jgi:carbonic anhydrase
MFAMSQILNEVLDANEAYVRSFGDKGKLALPPARRFAVLTCMDARLDPAKYAGLSEGDAHVIRNAGGRASDDAIRSLVISYKLLGTREFFVIHHTDCGMQFFTNEVIRGLLANSLETAELRRRFSRRRRRTRLARGRVRRVAAFLRCRASGRRRRRTNSPPSTRAPLDSDLRLHLRRENRQADRG